MESFLKNKLKRFSKRVNGQLHRLKHDILIRSYETRQFSLARKIVFDNYSEKDLLNDGLEIISLDAKVKILSSPSNKEARTTKNLPSLPARIQFSALAINGQWTISGVSFTNLQQPLSSTTHVIVVT